MSMIRAGAIDDLPLECRFMCRPKTQPRDIIASHGMMGYLIEKASPPDVAIVSADQLVAGPGGVQVRRVSHSPTANHPRPNTMSAHVGSRRNAVMAIMDTPIAYSTLS